MRGLTTEYEAAVQAMIVIYQFQGFFRCLKERRKKKKRKKEGSISGSRNVRN